MQNATTSNMPSSISNISDQRKGIITNGYKADWQKLGGSKDDEKL